jgi:hypothetical protein
MGDGRGIPLPPSTDDGAAIFMKIRTPNSERYLPLHYR